MCSPQVLISATIGREELFANHTFKGFPASMFSIVVPDDVSAIRVIVTSETYELVCQWIWSCHGRTFLAMFTQTVFVRREGLFAVKTYDGLGLRLSIIAYWKRCVVCSGA